MHRPLTSDSLVHCPGVPRVGAVVLAAGLSSRMGAFKPLLTLDDRPLLSHAIANLTAAHPIDPLVIVTGHHADLVRSTVAETSHAEFVHNPHYAEGGMLSSIRAGVAAVAGRCDAFLLALGDHPLVLPQTVSRILQAGAARGAKVAKPSYDGRRGHPVLIDSSLAPSILGLPADATLKTFLQSVLDHTLELPVDDPGILMDVDTPADFCAADRLYASRHAHKQHEPFAIGV